MKLTIRHFRNAFLALLAPLLSMCSRENSAPRHSGPEKIKVVVTTGMVADLARAVFADDAEITCLLPATVDPHSYSPSPADVRQLQLADVVVANGLRLEGKMEDTFETMQRRGRTVILLGDSFKAELVGTENKPGARIQDPHIWGDLSIWAETVPSLLKEVCIKYPNNATEWNRRGMEYRTRLMKAHALMKDQAKLIPEERRIIVTSHDAFRYFGKAYGFEVKAPQGLSTATEAGLRDVADLVDYIKEKQIPAIFVETSVSPAVVERLSRDTGAKIGGKLFSDALAPPGESIALTDGTTAGTDSVIGMQWSNMQTIVNALKSK